MEQDEQTHTSLTGIEETPTSMAMNQHALRKMDITEGGMLNEKWNLN